MRNVKCPKCGEPVDDYDDVDIFVLNGNVEVTVQFECEKCGTNFKKEFD